jgi:hypothetical protein
LNNRFLRIFAPVAVIALLAFAGIIDLSLLPWADPDFQATLATIAVYLIWTVLESETETDPSRITLYAILLVSVLDSFLLRLTAFSGLLILRWIGVLALALGSAMRISAVRSGNLGLLRHGRIGQGFGIALGLGSIAGTVLAVFPGIPSFLKEKA